MTRGTDDLAADLAMALQWAEPSRWEIGRMMLALRATAGADAMWQAVPEGRERLAGVCLRVAERWPDGPAAGLEFGHCRRVQWLDDAAAHEALEAAVENGWTPAQLGRWLTGLAPDEPATAAMAAQLAAEGDLIFRASGDGEWSLQGPVTTTIQPTIAKAVKAAWRQRYGRGGADNDPD